MYTHTHIASAFPNFSCSWIDDCLSFISEKPSPTVCNIQLVVITFIIWIIWKARNHMKFKKSILFHSALLSVQWNVQMAGKRSSKYLNDDMINLCILRFFLMFKLELPKVFELNRLSRSCLKWMCVDAFANIGVDNRLYFFWFHILPSKIG